MKRRLLATALTLSFAGHAFAADETFTDGQKAQIGQVAADYLRAHPDILIEMSQTLQAQVQSKQRDSVVAAALNNQDALLNDPSSPVLHPKGDVAVIQFFDYQCIYCAKVAPTVEQFISQNPDVRFIYKEWPIFGSRWPASVRAATAGLAVYKHGGAEAYHRYHAALFATGHNEGTLLEEDIGRAVLSTGVTATPRDEVKAQAARLEVNNQLAKRLGIQGTPAFYIMPVKGATAGNVSVLPGATTQQALQAAVDNARGGVKTGGG